MSLSLSLSLKHTLTHSLSLLHTHARTQSFFADDGVHHDSSFSFVWINLPEIEKKRSICYPIVAKVLHIKTLFLSLCIPWDDSVKLIPTCYLTSIQTGPSITNNPCYWALPQTSTTADDTLPMPPLRASWGISSFQNLNLRLLLPRSGAFNMIWSLEAKTKIFQPPRYMFIGNLSLYKDHLLCIIKTATLTNWATVLGFSSSVKNFFLGSFENVLVINCFAPLALTSWHGFIYLFQSSRHHHHCLILKKLKSFHSLRLESSGSDRALEVF